MRQRGKVQRKVSETLVREEAEVRDGAYEAEKEKKGFYACYLLASLNPCHKGHTYIGLVIWVFNISIQYTSLCFSFQFLSLSNHSSPPTLITSVFLST